MRTQAEKPARYKKVVSPEQVAHLWANQIQDEARTATRNLYFDGLSIYSYGGHFPIARHVENAKGQSVVFFTYRGYSVSTAKHIRIVDYASSHLDKIYVNNPNEALTRPSYEFERFLKGMKGELSGLLTARKPEKYIEPARRIYERAKIYADFMGDKFQKN